MCIGGAIISGILIFFSTFSPNVWLLILSYSLMGGFGLGMMFLPAGVAVAYYFNRKRSFAMGEKQRITKLNI